MIWSRCLPGRGALAKRGRAEGGRRGGCRGRTWQIVGNWGRLWRWGAHWRAKKMPMTAVLFLESSWWTMCISRGHMAPLSVCSDGAWKWN